MRLPLFGFSFYGLPFKTGADLEYSRVLDGFHLLEFNSRIAGDGINAGRFVVIEHIEGVSEDGERGLSDPEFLFQPQVQYGQIRKSPRTSFLGIDGFGSLSQIQSEVHASDGTGVALAGQVSEVASQVYPPRAVHQSLDFHLVPSFQRKPAEGVSVGIGVIVVTGPAPAVSEVGPDQAS